MAVDQAAPGVGREGHRAGRDHRGFERDVVHTQLLGEPPLQPAGQPVLLGPDAARGVPIDQARPLPVEALACPRIANELARTGGEHIVAARQEARVVLQGVAAQRAAVAAGPVEGDRTLDLDAQGERAEAGDEVVGDPFRLDDLPGLLDQSGVEVPDGVGDRQRGVLQGVADRSPRPGIGRTNATHRPSLGGFAAAVSFIQHRLVGDNRHQPRRPFPPGRPANGPCDLDTGGPPPGLIRGAGE